MDVVDRILKRLAAIEVEHLRRKQQPHLQQPQQQPTSTTTEHCIQLSNTDSAAAVALSRWADSSLADLCRAVMLQVGSATHPGGSVGGLTSPARNGGISSSPAALSSTRTPATAPVVVVVASFTTAASQQHPSSLLLSIAQIAAAFSSVRMELFRIHSATSYRLGVQVAAAHAITSWAVAELRLYWNLFLLRDVAASPDDGDDGTVGDERWKKVTAAISGVLADFCKWSDRIVGAGPSIFDLAVVESAFEAKRVLLSACVAEWIAVSIGCLHNIDTGNTNNNNNNNSSGSISENVDANNNSPRRSRIQCLWTHHLGPVMLRTLLSSQQNRSPPRAGNSNARSGGGGGRNYSNSDDISMSGYSLTLREASVIVVQSGVGRALNEWEASVARGLDQLVLPHVAAPASSSSSSSSYSSTPTKEAANERPLARHETSTTTTAPSTHDAHASNHRDHILPGGSSSRSNHMSPVYGIPLLSVSFGSSSATELSESLLSCLRHMFLLAKNEMAFRKKTEMIAQEEQSRQTQQQEGNKQAAEDTAEAGGRKAETDRIVQGALNALAGKRSTTAIVVGAYENSNSFVCNDVETFHVRSSFATLIAAADTMLLLRDDVLGSTHLTSKIVAMMMKRQRRSGSSSNNSNNSHVLAAAAASAAASSPASSVAFHLRSTLWKSLGLVSAIHSLGASATSSSTSSSTTKKQSSAGPLTLLEEAAHVENLLIASGSTDHHGVHHGSSVRPTSKKRERCAKTAGIIVALRSLYRGENFSSSLLGIDSTESHHLTSRPEHGAALAQASSIDTLVPGETDLRLMSQRIALALVTIPTGTVKAIDVLRRMLVRRTASFGQQQQQQQRQQQQNQRNQCGVISAAQLDSATIDDLADSKSSAGGFSGGGSGGGFGAVAENVPIAFTTPHVGGRLLDWVVLQAPSPTMVEAVMQTLGAVVPAVAEKRPALLRQAVSLLVSPAVPTDALADFLTRQQQALQQQFLTEQQRQKLQQQQQHQQQQQNLRAYNNNRLRSIVEQQGDLRAFALHVISSAVQSYSLTRLRRAVDPLILRVGFQFGVTDDNTTSSSSSSSGQQQQRRQHQNQQNNETLARIVAEFCDSESNIARVSAEMLILALERRVSDVRPVDRDFGAVLMRCARQALMHQATVIRVLKALPEQTASQQPPQQQMRVTDNFSRRSHEVCLRLFRCLANRFEDVLVASQAHIMLASLQLLDLCAAADASGVSASGAPATVRNLTLTSSSTAAPSGYPAAAAAAAVATPSKHHDDELLLLGTDRDSRSSQDALSQAMRAIKYSVVVVPATRGSHHRGGTGSTVENRGGATLQQQHHSNKQLVPVSFTVTLDNVPAKMPRAQLLTVEVWGPRASNTTTTTRSSSNNNNNNNKTMKSAAPHHSDHAIRAQEEDEVQRTRILIDAFSLLLPEINTASSSQSFSFSCNMHVPRNIASVSPFAPYSCSVWSAADCAHDLGDCVSDEENDDDASLSSSPQRVTAIGSATVNASTMRAGGAVAAAAMTANTATVWTPSRTVDEEQEDASSTAQAGITGSSIPAASAMLHSRRVCDAPIVAIRFSVASGDMKNHPSSKQRNNNSNNHNSASSSSIIPPPLAELALHVPGVLSWMPAPFGASALSSSAAPLAAIDLQSQQQLLDFEELGGEVMSSSMQTTTTTTTTTTSSLGAVTDKRVAAMTAAGTPRRLFSSAVVFDSAQQAAAVMQKLLESFHCPSPSHRQVAIFTSRARFPQILVAVAGAAARHVCGPDRDDGRDEKRTESGGEKDEDAAALDQQSVLLLRCVVADALVEQQFKQQQQQQRAGDTSDVLEALVLESLDAVEAALWELLQA